MSKSRSSSTSGNKIVLPGVNAGESIAIPAVAGSQLAFGFDIAEAAFERVGNNLVIVLSHGGTVVVENYFSIEASALPEVVLSDGSSVSGLDALAENKATSLVFEREPFVSEAEKSEGRDAASESRAVASQPEQLQEHLTEAAMVKGLSKEAPEALFDQEPEAEAGVLGDRVQQASAPQAGQAQQLQASMAGAKAAGAAAQSEEVVAVAHGEIASTAGGNEAIEAYGVRSDKVDISVSEAGLSSGSRPLSGSHMTPYEILEVPAGLVVDVTSYQGALGSLYLSYDPWDNIFEYRYVLERPHTDKVNGKNDGRNTIVEAEKFVLDLMDAQGSKVGPDGKAYGQITIYVDVEDDVPYLHVAQSEDKTTGMQETLVAVVETLMTGADGLDTYLMKINGGAYRRFQLDESTGDYKLVDAVGSFRITSSGEIYFAAASNDKATINVAIAVRDQDGDIAVSVGGSFDIDVGEEVIKISFDGADKSFYEKHLADGTAPESALLVKSVDLGDFRVNTKGWTTINGNPTLFINQGSGGTGKGYFTASDNGTKLVFTLSSPFTNDTATEATDKAWENTYQLNLIHKTDGRHVIGDITVNVVDDEPTLTLVGSGSVVIGDTQSTVVGTATIHFGADNGTGKAVLLKGSAGDDYTAATFTTADQKWVWWDGDNKVTIDKAGNVEYLAGSKGTVRKQELYVMVRDADGDETADGNKVEFVVRPETGPGDLANTKAALQAQESELAENGSHLVAFPDNYVTDQYDTKWFFSPNQSYAVEYDGQVIGQLMVDELGGLSFTLYNAVMHTKPDNDEISKPITVNVDVNDGEFGGTGSVKVTLTIEDDVPTLKLSNKVDEVEGNNEVIIAKSDDFSFGADDGAGKKVFINNSEAIYNSATKQWEWLLKDGIVTLGKVSIYDGADAARKGEVRFKKIADQPDSDNKVRDITLNIELQDADGDRTGANSDNTIKFTYRPEEGPKDADGKAALLADEAYLTSASEHIVTYKDTFVTDAHGTKWYFLEGTYNIYDPANAARQIGELVVDAQGKMSFKLTDTITHSVEGRDISDAIVVNVNVSDRAEFKPGTGKIEVHLTIQDDIPTLTLGTTITEVVGDSAAILGKATDFLFGADNGDGKAVLINGEPATYDSVSNTWSAKILAGGAGSKELGTVTITANGEISYKTTELHATQTVKFTLGLQDADEDKTQLETIEFVYRPVKPDEVKPDGLGNEFSLNEAGLAQGTQPESGSHTVKFDRNYVEDSYLTKWYFNADQTIPIFYPQLTNNQIGFASVGSDGKLVVTLTESVKHPAGLGANIVDTEISVLASDKHGMNNIPVKVKINIIDDVPTLALTDLGSTLTGVTEGQVAESLKYLFGADGDPTGAGLLVNGTAGTLDQATGVTTYVLQDGTLRISKDGKVFFKANENKTGSYEVTFSLTDADGDTVDKSITVDVVRNNIDIEVPVVLHEKHLSPGTEPQLNEKGDYSTEWADLPQGFVLNGEANISVSSNIKMEYRDSPDTQGVVQYRVVLTSRAIHSEARGEGEIITNYATVEIPVKDANGDTGKVALKISLTDDAPTIDMVNLLTDAAGNPVYLEVGKEIAVAKIRRFNFGADGPAKSGKSLRVNGEYVVYDGNKFASIWEDAAGNTIKVQGDTISVILGDKSKGSLPITFEVIDGDGDIARESFAAPIKSTRSISGDEPQAEGLEDLAPLGALLGENQEEAADLDSIQVANIASSGVEGVAAASVATPASAEQSGVLDVNQAAEANILVNGAADDVLFGTEGKDIFVFESDAAGGTSVIKDFSIADGDKIDLGNLMHDPAAGVDELLGSIQLELGEDYVAVKFHDSVNGLEQTINTEITGTFEINDVAYNSWSEFTTAYNQSDDQDAMLRELAVKLLVD